MRKQRAFTRLTEQENLRIADWHGKDGTKADKWYAWNFTPKNAIEPVRAKVFLSRPRQ
jgi:hypothetical protein